MKLFLLLGIAILLALPSPIAVSIPIKYSVITSKNAHRLKQVARVGNGVIGGGLAYSPDGKTLAVSSSLGVWLFDNNGPFDKPSRFLDQDDWIHNVAFTPDGKILAAAGNKSIWLWDVRTGKKVGTFPGDTLVAFSPDGRLLATRGLTVGYGGWPNATVRLFDAATGAELSILIADHWSTRMTDIAFSPDGKLIAAIWSATSYGSGCYDDAVQRLQVWRMKDVIGKWQVTPEDMLYSAKTVGLRFAFSPDSSILVHGNPEKDGGIAVWNTRTHSVQTVWDTGWFDNAVFNSNGAFLAVAKRDSSSELYRYSTTLYDAENGKIIRTLTDEGLESATFSKDNSTLAGFWGTALRLFHLPNGYMEDVEISHPLALSANGSIATVDLLDNTFRIYDLVTLTSRSLATEKSGVARKSLFSNDGKLLVMWNGDNKVRIWNTAIGTLQTTLPETFPVAKGNYFSMAMNVDGSTLATDLIQEGQDESIFLWNTTTGMRVGTIDGGIRSSGLTFSPHGSLLIVYRKGNNDYTQTMELWNTDISGIRKLATFNANFPIAFNEQGTVFVYRDVGSVYVYDVANNKSTSLLTLKSNHWSDVYAAFNADGSRLALSEVIYQGCGPGFSQIFHMYDTKSQSESNAWTKVPSWSAASESLVFNPRGDVFVATADNALLVWETSTATKLATLSNHTESIRRIAFIADGTLLVSRSADGTVRLWAVQ